MLRPSIALVALVFAAGPSGASPDSTVDPIAKASGVDDPGFRLIVHHRNPVDSLSREEVAALFLLAEQRWKNGELVEPVEQLADSQIHAAFSRYVHAKSAAAVEKYWQEKAVAARQGPRLVRLDDRGVIQWVRFHTRAVGYVSASSVPVAGVKVVEITDEDSDDEEDKPSRISLVLDASGSMRAPVNGRPKLEIARDVLRKVLADWDPEISLGLVVYGHRDGSCQDIETLVPVDRGGAAPVAAALEQIRAKGSTPLTRAVIQAARDVARAGEETRVVLISDGEETCGMDPCELHEATEREGVGFTAYVVGFDILRNSKAQSQLRCLAQKSGGSFQLAWDAKSLRKALRIALARATGKEVIEDAPIVAEAAEPERTLDLRLEYVAAGEVAASRSPQQKPEGKSATVRVKDDFWITDSEITQGDWQLLMGGNPSYFRSCGSKCPVERVSLFDAMMFANRLSQHEGREVCYRLADCRGMPGGGCAEGESSCANGFFCSYVAPREQCDGYRLPTSSEWRYAAQADRETAFWWGDELTPEDARCAGNSWDGKLGTEEARSMPANRFGLYEVHGNVAEWTRDARAVIYTPADSYTTADSDDEPSAPASLFQDLRVSWRSREQESAAGGSWGSPEASCYASGRAALAAGERSHHVGFRLVRSARR